MKLTPKQAALRMCVSVSLVYALLQKRKIPAYRIGVLGRGRYVLESDDVDAFMARCKLEELPEVRDEKFTILK